MPPSNPPEPRRLPYLAWDELPPYMRETWVEHVRSVTLPPLCSGTSGQDVMSLDFNALGAEIDKDPVLCAKMLAVANSAAFGLASRVTSAERAVAYMGLNLVQSVMVAYHMEAVTGRWPKYPRAHFEYCRRHAAAATVIANGIAGALKLPDKPMLATAALLSRLGALLLGLAFPPPGEDYRTLLDENLRLHYEVQKYQVSTPLLSSELVRSWGLPEPLPSLLAHHCNPIFIAGQPSAQLDMELVICVANALAGTYVTWNQVEAKSTLELPAYSVLLENMRQFQQGDLLQATLSALASAQVQKELAAACD